jgi:hypothetical protein
MTSPTTSRADTASRADTVIPAHTASDVPLLRRALADYHASPAGTLYYHRAILIDRQPLRPDGPPGQAAERLAAAEATRLREADLWYIDEDLCTLLAAAHRSMPAFAPRPPDLPSRTGFTVFAKPIATWVRGTDEGADKIVDTLDPTGTDTQLRTAARRLHRQEARIVAASWGPARHPAWPAGGLWMSFYAHTPPADSLFDDPATRQRLSAMLPPLMVDNEAALAWRPDGAAADDYLLPGPNTPETPGRWARLVFTTFQLAAQATLASTGHLRTPRPERRRTARAGLPERDVRIIRLRHNPTGDQRRGQPAETTGAYWRHRWVVRGHWRNQWFPRLADHRPTWIAPHLKGPADAPLLGGTKVSLASAPTPAPVGAPKPPGGQ